MHAPGVSVRPLRQMTGGLHFNEVFLDGVRIPDAQRLGPVGGGWGVAMTTLMNERMAIGGIERWLDWDALLAPRPRQPRAPRSPSRATSWRASTPGCARSS